MKAQEKLSVDMNLKTAPTDKINFDETNVSFKINKKINAKSKVTNTLNYSH